MENSNNSSGDEEDNFYDVPNFQLKFFAGPHMRDLLKKRAEVESAGWTKAHGTRRRPRKQQTGLYQPFEVSNA